MNHESNAVRATPATAQVINLGELHEQRAGSASAVQEKLNPLHAVRATLQVCVGQAQISVGELLSAKEDEVIVLDSSLHEPVELRLEGQVVARGELVAFDGRFAVRITDVPVALAP